MDDFSRDESYYQNIEQTEDVGNFTNTLMTITHFLKSIDFENQMKSGHELMMKIFNMTNLDESQDNEEALNVIMSLISHVFTMLTVNREEDRENYFAFFDETIMYPLIRKNNNE